MKHPRTVPRLGRRSALALCCVSMAACAAPGSGPNASPGVATERSAALEAMVQAERDFSARSGRDGVRDAFLAYLADDGVLFRPGPVNGKEWFSTRPSPPVVLTWRPAIAAISCAGELGFTAGPYAGRPREGGDAGHGYYYTLWRRQPDGDWKFVLDIGTPGPPPAEPAADWTPGAPIPCGQVGAVPAGELDRAEAAFARAWAGGAASALAAWADADVTWGRAGAPPAHGIAAATGAASRESGPVTWTPAATHLSTDGSLAYVYGEYTRAPADGPRLAGNYVRVWRRTAQGWRVLLDVVNARPPQPAAGGSSAANPGPRSGPAVVDVMPAFWRFWAEAQGRSDSARVALFRERVIRPNAEVYAAIAPGLTDARIVRALDEMAPRAEAMRALSASMPERVRQEWSAAARLLPGLTGDAAVYLLPSFGAFDGQVRPVGGRAAVLFGIDVIAAGQGARPSEPFIRHELFHLYHMQVNPGIAQGFAALFERGQMPPLYTMLWVEGLAVYAAAEMSPGASPEAVLNSPTLAREAGPRTAALARELRAKLQSTSGPDIAAFFFLGPSGRADVPPRSGYYIGQMVARELGKRYTLDQLARLDIEPLRAEIDAILRGLESAP